MHPLFKGATVTSLREKTYKRNDCIFNEGDRCEEICLVIKGSVAIKTFTAFEEEYTIRTINEGGLFGEFLMFSNDPFYYGSVYALKETTIGFVNKKELLTFLKNDTILTNYLHIVSEISIENQSKIKILSQKSIRNKIIFYLINRSKLEKTRKIYITSKEELASLLNIPRPSLSRELISLQNEGILKFDRYSITLLYL